MGAGAEPPHFNHCSGVTVRDFGRVGGTARDNIICLYVVLDTQTWILWNLFGVTI